MDKDTLSSLSQKAFKYVEEKQQELIQLRLDLDNTYDLDYKKEILYTFKKQNSLNKFYKQYFIENNNADLLVSFITKPHLDTTIKYLKILQNYLNTGWIPNMDQLNIIFNFKIININQNNLKKEYINAIYQKREFTKSENKKANALGCFYYDYPFDKDMLINLFSSINNDILINLTKLKLENKEIFDQDVYDILVDAYNETKNNIIIKLIKEWNFNKIKPKTDTINKIQMYFNRTSNILDYVELINYIKSIDPDVHITKEYTLTQFYKLAYPDKYDDYLVINRCLNVNHIVTNDEIEVLKKYNIKITNRTNYNPEIMHHLFKNINPAKDFFSNNLEMPNLLINYIVNNSINNKTTELLEIYLMNKWLPTKEQFKLLCNTKAYRNKIKSYYINEYELCKKDTIFNNFVQLCVDFGYPITQEELEYASLKYHIIRDPYSLGLKITKQMIYNICINHTTHCYIYEQFEIREDILDDDLYFFLLNPYRYSNLMLLKNLNINNKKPNQNIINYLIGYNMFKFPPLNEYLLSLNDNEPYKIASLKYDYSNLDLDD